MVNPGHASKGCLNCRSRRIKCDEAWPSCQRCFAGGRTCLGYRGRSRRVVVEDARGELGSRSVSVCDPTSPPPERRSLDVVESTSTSARLTARFASDTPNSEADSNDRQRRSSEIQHHTPSQCILGTVAICFDGLQDPFQSRETRKLMLQSYHNALHILRVALLSDRHDHALIAPTRSLACYEVCCFASCRPRPKADRFADGSLI
jgi:hypothetical protein